MTPGITFAVFQTVIILPFCAGFLLRQRIADPQQFTRRLLRINIILLEPLIVVWCVWGLELSGTLLLLPFFGLLLVLCGLCAGIMAAPLLDLAEKRRSTFLISASLGNHGFTMGGILCYLFLGEQGLGLSVILVLYFIPYVYGCIFPYAKAAASAGQHEQKSIFREYILDARNMPLVALAATVVLHVLGIRRPAIAVPVDLLLALSIALYYLTLGINFISGNLRGLLREHLCLAGIKFLVVPLVTAGILFVVPCDQSVKAVILLQACMPAAVYSVVTAVLFELDAPFASSLFVVNTAFFLGVVLPLLFFVKGLIPGV